MGGIERITQPTLDVLEVLLQATVDATSTYGWAIMKATKRSGPTVYNVLDRLEEAGLVTAEWQEQEPEATTPRRRYYQLTGEGVRYARRHLAERRTAQTEPRPALGMGLLRALLRGAS